MLPYKRTLKINARALRGNMTDAENALWQKIRRKQLGGVQFYRQKPLGPYIVDFYSAAAHTVIELDGSQHAEPEHRANDQLRDQYLQQLGLRVLRFDNWQVLQEMDSVLQEILCAVNVPDLPNPP